MISQSELSLSVHSLYPRKSALFHGDNTAENWCAALDGDVISETKRLSS